MLHFALYKFLIYHEGSYIIQKFILLFVHVNFSFKIILITFISQDLVHLILLSYIILSTDEGEMRQQQPKLPLIL